MLKVNNKHIRTMSFVTSQNDSLIVTLDLLVSLSLTFIKTTFITLTYYFGALASMHLFKANYKITRTVCKICTKLTIKTPEQPQ